MSAPVHVLMLPSSTAASAANSEAAQPELASFMGENAGDYLDRRCQILKGQKKMTGLEGPGDSAKFEHLWSGSSPLEVAIATCCDHEGEEQAIPSAGGEIGDNSSSSSFMVESGSSDTSARVDRIANGDKKQRKKSSGMYHCGAIGRGREGKFAALIARHCHTAGDRALCLAILQRTMERDEMISKQQRGKKRKRNEETPSPPTSSTGSTNSEEPSESPEDATAQAENGNMMYTDDSEFDCHRMANFLSAGGLKVLNQWLIDAFTPVTKPAEAAGSTRSKKRKQPTGQEITVGTMTSPTGPILLPLLTILQSIPFNIELVKHSQINKQIKKLKKNLDRLVANFDEEESDSESSSSDDDYDELKGKRHKRTLEALTHPVSGGMPVVQVQRDVEKLMQTWKDAASDKSDKGDDFSPGGVYGKMRAMMEERFLVLSRFESGEGEKPAWLEKLDPAPSELKSPAQALSVQKAAIAAKKRQEDQPKRQSEASKRLQQQQADLKAAQAARLEAREKMEQYRKRMMQRDGTMQKKGKAEAVETKDGPVDKKPALRNVTWSDQKVAGAKLVEVREFVRETDVYQSDEEEKIVQDSEDGNDEKFEEGDFDDGDYDETQASDSVDSDNFDGMLKEEGANFSQEEGKGFTIEAQGLRGHKTVR